MGVAQEGKNLLFSLAFRPLDLEAHSAFVLSEAMALSVCEALSTYADGFCVKWPNDIYHGTRKVAGMLIENDLMGRRVDRCVIGVGLNVNQCEFESDAPNPVSLMQITGREMEREEVLGRLMERFEDYRSMVDRRLYADIHRRYLSHLYRMGEEHAYADAQGDFRATIIDVEPTGNIILRDTEGQTRRYAFKEIIYK